MTNQIENGTSFFESIHIEWIFDKMEFGRVFYAIWNLITFKDDCFFPVTID